MVVVKAVVLVMMVLHIESVALKAIRLVDGLRGERRLVVRESIDDLRWTC